MRRLPPFGRTVCAAVLTGALLLGPATVTSPSAALPAASQIWAPAVNEPAEAVRRAIAEYPWPQQEDRPQRRNAASPRSDGDSAGRLAQNQADQRTQENAAEGRSRMPHDGRAGRDRMHLNPAGPVDCSAQPCVALTFDDGPVQQTRQILEALDSVSARASFFMLGSMVAQNPDITAEVAAAGHQIGSHGWSHTAFDELTPAELAEELDRTAEAIQGATGTAPTLVRPPFGTTNPQINAALGAPVILWDTDSGDWRHQDAEQTLTTVAERVAPGSIVLLHDLQPSTAEAVPQLLDRLLADGYALVTVAEILGHSGQPGQVYQSGLAPRGEDRPQG